MNEERLTALSLAIETGTDMHFDKEELEWLIAAARERNKSHVRLIAFALAFFLKVQDWRCYAMHVFLIGGETRTFRKGKSVTGGSARVSP